MLQRFLRYFHALLQFYTDLFLFAIENGFLSASKLAFNFATNQPIIRVDYPKSSENSTKTLFFNAETYHRVTLHHILHAYPQMNKLIAAIPPKKYDYIFDLGANCGHFSIVAADNFPEAKIYAFEPSPSLHPILKKNIANRNINIVEKAVADSIGTTKFHINLAGQQTNSILEENVAAFNKDYQVIEVALTTLDAFTTEHYIPNIDILKIDCQGAESLILRGGEKILQKTTYLILEITFLDNDVRGLLNQVAEFFPYHKVINAVSLGADLIFSKQPLNQ
jgi:FkbM family methyltransferase